VEGEPECIEPSEFESDEREACIDALHTALSKHEQERENLRSLPSCCNPTSTIARSTSALASTNALLRSANRRLSRHLPTLSFTSNPDSISNTDDSDSATLLRNLQAARAQRSKSESLLNAPDDDDSAHEGSVAYVSAPDVSNANNISKTDAKDPQSEQRKDATQTVDLHAPGQAGNVVHKLEPSSPQQGSTSPGFNGRAEKDSAREDTHCDKAFARELELDALNVELEFVRKNIEEEKAELQRLQRLRATEEAVMASEEHNAILPEATCSKQIDAAVQAEMGFDRRAPAAQMEASEHVDAEVQADSMIAEDLVLQERRTECANAPDAGYGGEEQVEVREQDGDQSPLPGCWQLDEAGYEDEASVNNVFPESLSSGPASGDEDLEGIVISPSAEPPQVNDASVQVMAEPLECEQPPVCMELIVQDAPVEMNLNIAANSDTRENLKVIDAANEDEDDESLTSYTSDHHEVEKADIATEINSQSIDAVCQTDREEVGKGENSDDPVQLTLHVDGAESAFECEQRSGLLPRQLNAEVQVDESGNFDMNDQAREMLFASLPSLAAATTVDKETQSGAATQLRRTVAVDCSYLEPHMTDTATTMDEDPNEQLEANVFLHMNVAAEGGTMETAMYDAETDMEDAQPLHDISVQAEVSQNASDERSCEESACQVPERHHSIMVSEKLQAQPDVLHQEQQTSLAGPDRSEIEIVTETHDSAVQTCEVSDAGGASSKNTVDVSAQADASSERENSLRSEELGKVEDVASTIGLQNQTREELSDANSVARRADTEILQGDSGAASSSVSTPCSRNRLGVYEQANSTSRSAVIVYRTASSTPDASKLKGIRGDFVEREGFPKEFSERKGNKSTESPYFKNRLSIGSQAVPENRHEMAGLNANDAPAIAKTAREGGFAYPEEHDDYAPNSAFADAGDSAFTAVHASKRRPWRRNGSPRDRVAQSATHSPEEKREAARTDSFVDELGRGERRARQERHISKCMYVSPPLIGDGGLGATTLIREGGGDSHFKQQRERMVHTC